MKLRRKKGTNRITVVLLFVLIAMSIGYASFSESLKIIGTANTNGKFDLAFISSKITNSKGINALQSKAVISEDGDMLTIDIKDMEYPGAGATISCVVQNLGTIPAKLKSANIIGNDDEDISVIFEDSNKIGQTLEVNGMWTLRFVVKWNIESTLEENKTVNFSITLDYEQDTQEYISET